MWDIGVFFFGIGLKVLFLVLDIIMNKFILSINCCHIRFLLNIEFNVNNTNLYIFST